MVGGIVIEVCDHPADQRRLYVNVVDGSYGRRTECAVYHEKNEASSLIEMGDALWWQSSYAYWTPQKNRVDHAEHPCMRHGQDYDIKIPKIGYSGVDHPTRQMD